MAKRYEQKFWQSHECKGYYARVTIEWSAPEGVELPLNWAAEAEAVADEIFHKIGVTPFAVVQSMMGRSG